VTLLRSYIPDIRIRVVNVVGLMASQPQTEHPHGLEDRDFDAMFTRDKPVIFAFHGYPRMIHRLTYRRHNHDNFDVRGYKEEGTTTTPFDMVVLNNLDRYQLALDAISHCSPIAKCRRRPCNGERRIRYRATATRAVCRPSEEDAQIAVHTWELAGC